MFKIMYKSSICLFLYFPCVTASASPFSIECPDPNALQFIQQHTEPSWDEYFAKGDVKVVSGEYPPSTIISIASETATTSSFLIKKNQ